MGLAEELGYNLQPQRGWLGSVGRLSSSRPGSAVLRRVMRSIDTLTRKLSGGRGTLSEWLAGLPPLWLTTTGARTGQPREAPLFGVPIGDGLAVLGTSYGQKGTPSWVFNLEANPDASVSFHDRVLPVRARPATDEEEVMIWETATRIYPGYPRYRERAAHRKIRVFVLEMRDSV